MSVPASPALDDAASACARTSRPRGAAALLVFVVALPGPPRRPRRAPGDRAGRGAEHRGGAGARRAPGRPRHASSRTRSSGARRTGTSPNELFELRRSAANAQARRRRERDRPRRSRPRSRRRHERGARALPGARGARAVALRRRGDRDGALDLPAPGVARLMHDRILPAAGRLDAVDREPHGPRVRPGAVASAVPPRPRRSRAERSSWARSSPRRSSSAGRMRRRLVPALLAATLLSRRVHLVPRRPLPRRARGPARRARRRVQLDPPALAGDAPSRTTRAATRAAGCSTASAATSSSPAFRSKMTQLVSQPGRWRVGSADLGSGHVTGLLVDEARNVTFDGEAAAVDADFALLADYVAVDDEVRSLERQGKHAQAVDRCVGLARRPGEGRVRPARRRPPEDDRHQPAARSTPRPPTAIALSRAPSGSTPHSRSPSLCSHGSACAPGCASMLER